MSKSGLCAALLVLACGMMAHAANAKVLKVTGEVVAIRSFAKRVIAPGDELLAKDILVTEFGESATVQLPDGSEVAVGENSRLKLTKFMASREDKQKNQLVEIFNGTGSFKVKPLEGHPDHFTVKTPVAVVGVRGTKLLVNHQTTRRGKQKSSVSVVVGRVVVMAVGFVGSSLASPVFVSRLETSSVSSDAPPTPAAPISLGQLNQIEASAGLDASTQQETVEPAPGGPVPDPNAPAGANDKPADAPSGQQPQEPASPDNAGGEQPKPIRELIQEVRLDTIRKTIDGTGPTPSAPVQFDAQKLNENIFKRRIGRPVAPPVSR